MNAGPVTHGATAVQFAAINSNFAKMEILLKPGGNVNAPVGDDEDGRTTLEGAAERGRLDMVLYLLNLGANVEGRTDLNYRRTMYRASRNPVLVAHIQEWKRVRYGEEDCESLAVILKTVTRSELREDAADEDSFEEDEGDDFKKDHYVDESDIIYEADAEMEDGDGDGSVYGDVSENKDDHRKEGNQEVWKEWIKEKILSE